MFLKSIILHKHKHLRVLSYPYRMLRSIRELNRHLTNVYRTIIIRDNNGINKIWPRQFNFNYFVRININVRPFVRQISIVQTGTFQFDSVNDNRCISSVFLWSEIVNCALDEIYKKRKDALLYITLSPKSIFVFL